MYDISFVALLYLSKQLFLTKFLSIDKTPPPNDLEKPTTHQPTWAQTQIKFEKLKDSL